MSQPSQQLIVAAGAVTVSLATLLSRNRLRPLAIDRAVQLLKPTPHRTIQLKTDPITTTISCNQRGKTTVASNSVMDYRVGLSQLWSDKSSLSQLLCNHQQLLTSATVDDKLGSIRSHSQPNSNHNTPVIDNSGNRSCPAKDKAAITTTTTITTVTGGSSSNSSSGSHSDDTDKRQPMPVFSLIILLVGSVVMAELIDGISAAAAGGIPAAAT